MDMIKSTLCNVFKNSFSDSVEVSFWDGETILFGEEDPAFTLKFHKSISDALLQQDTALALAESYMDGDIEIEGNAQKFIESLYASGTDSFMKKSSKLTAALGKIKNNKTNSKKNAHYHYDIGNDFYKLWLDDSMTYSCGYFKTANDSLNLAQKNKVEYILKKLNLKEGQTLLDIGCGWGELIIKAAKIYGAKAYGITLSEEQHARVKERIIAEGLEGKIEVGIRDYRDIKDESFDRIVSVGMLEHVGKDNLSVYFSQVKKLLSSGGVSLVHSITTPNAGANNAFLNKYIFPGGYVPGIKEIVSDIAESGFHITDVESLRRHYGKTLECWSTNFENNLEQIKATKDDRFIRMWRLFLSGCAASFNTGNIDLHQIVFTKGVNNVLPWTRQAIYGTESNITQ